MISSRRIPYADGSPRGARTERWRRGDVRASWAAAVGAVLLLTQAACNVTPPPDPPKGPNIVFITMDTTRRDHCSVYGYERDTTPNLRAVADAGALFNLAYAPTASTGPSHATMFTSLYPVAHRVIKNGRVLTAEHETLAEILQGAGYETAAVVSSFVLDAKFGYAQGFDSYDDDMAFKRSSMRMREWEGHTIEKGFDQRADDVTKKAIRWVTKQRDPRKNFLLFIHYFDPHSPYSPPKPFASRFGSPSPQAGDMDGPMRRYDEEILFMDHEIGRFLESLDALAGAENTIVVVAGDHGECLGQHGHLEHGLNIYEEAVRVPLLIRWPGQVAPGTVFQEPVEMVDLVPTLLELAGIQPKDVGFQGKSLARALQGKASLDAGRPVFLHRRHYVYNPGIPTQGDARGEKFAIRVRNWKYIEGPEEGTKELFNLEQDPGELANLYDTERERGLTHSAHLREFIKTHRANDLPSLPISDEDREALEAMGYLQ